MSWRLNASRAALLVIDVQERLVPAIAESSALVRRIALAVSAARLFAIPVYLTEQAPEKLGRTHPDVLAALGEDAAGPVRTLGDFSKAGCFAAGELPQDVLVTGIETHVCIRQTVFDLGESGHTVRVLADAVGSRSSLDHRLALHEMRELAGARVTTVETVFWEILGRADGEYFKPFLALVK